MGNKQPKCVKMVVIQNVLDIIKDWKLLRQFILILIHIEKGSAN